MTLFISEKRITCEQQVSMVRDPINSKKTAEKIFWIIFTLVRGGMERNF